MEIVSTRQISEFLTVLEKAEKLKAPNDFKADVVICCLFFGDKGPAVKTLSFSTTPLMQIDGVTYERNETLFSYVIEKYFPKDYLKLK